MNDVKEDMVPLQVKVPRELRARFKTVAARKERPVADILREFIAWYVEKEEKA